MRFSTIKRWLPILIIISLIAAYFLFGLNQTISLDQVKQHLSAIKQFSQTHPVLTPILLIMFYITIVAIPTPLSSSVCMIAGFLFPLAAAVIYCTIGETIGSVLLLLAVRTSFGQALKKSSSKKIQALMNNMKKSATLYIITLRLSCVFPSAIINITSGLIDISAIRYAVITFFSSIAGSFIYSFFGRGAEKILLSNKPIRAGDLFTPPIIIMLVLIISLTIAAHAYQQYRKKQ